jgi:hypothetical protein
MPRTMSDMCDYLVLDVLCDLCFGQSVDTKEPGENEYRKIPHAMTSLLQLLYPVCSHLSTRELLLMTLSLVILHG